MQRLPSINNSYWSTVMKRSNRAIKKLIPILFERRKVIAFLFIVIIFVPIVLYGQNYTSQSFSEGVIQDSSVIIPVNTIYSLEPGHYTYVHFLILNGKWDIEGAITSSTYVSFYIVNHRGFLNLTCDLPYHPIYYAFADSFAIINTTLEPGSYYLIFYDRSTVWGVGVEVTSPFYLTKQS